MPTKQQFYASGLCVTNWNEDPPVYPFNWTRVTRIREANRLVFAPYRFPITAPVTPDVMEAIRSQNERLTDDGVLYDVTALFQKIFATHGQTEITLVNGIEIALWLLREQDYRHFYRELHAFTNPTDTAQDLSCDLIRVTDFSENQVETKTLF